MLGGDFDGRIHIQLLRAPDGLEQEIAQRINDLMHELHTKAVLLMANSHF